MIALDGLNILIMTGLGAIVGVLFSIPLFIVALLNPQMWPYVIIPAICGLLSGFAFSIFTGRV